MIVKACRTTTKRENVDIYETIRHIEKDHPLISEIINQVRNAPTLTNDDKRLCEKELLTMASILYDVENYTLIVGKWSGFWNASGYSMERLRVAKEEKTVVNETLFTIVSYGHKDNWAAYVDLPINVVL